MSTEEKKQQEASEKAAQEKAAKEAAEKAAQEKAELESLRSENEALKAKLSTHPDTIAEKKKEQQAKKDAVSAEQSKYDRFIELQFIVLDGGKLTETAQKEFDSFKEEVQKRKGKKPIRTVTAAFGNRKIQLVKGIAVPKEISDFIDGQGHSEYYFG